MKLLGCDLCRRSEGPGRHVSTMFIVTGRGLDAAGSVDDFGDNVDLCNACTSRLFADIIAERDYERNKKILDRIRRVKK